LTWSSGRVWGRPFSCSGSYRLIMMISEWDGKALNYNFWIAAKLDLFEVDN